MYTLHGLKSIADAKVDVLPVSYLKEGVNFLKKSMEYIDKIVQLLHDEFNKEIEVELSSFKEAIQHYQEQVNAHDEISKEMFTEAYELAVKATEKEKEMYAILYEEVERLSFKKIEPIYLALKANSISFHKLGFFNYAMDNCITVHFESDDYYMGSLWYSNFVNVIFKKDDVRPLTEEEKRQERVI